MNRDLTREEQDKLDYVNGFQRDLAKSQYADIGSLASLVTCAIAGINPISLGLTAGFWTLGRYFLLRAGKRDKDRNALSDAFDTVISLENEGAVCRTFHGTYSLRRDAAQAA